MDWQTRRQVSYALGVGFLLIASSIFYFRDSLFPDPTCYDKKQNGNEAGIDCGGICSMRCSADIIPLSVKWSRAIKVSQNTYDLVAVIANKNVEHTSHQLGYTFISYNTRGEATMSFSGTTTVPVNGDFPIIKQNVKITEIPKEIVVTLSDTSHFIAHENATAPTLRVFNPRYEAGETPRVYATILNTRRIAFSNIPVRVVLYDVDNNAFAVGETLIPSLDKEESKDISFIWYTPFKDAPANIRVYPIFDPFSLDN